MELIVWKGKVIKHTHTHKTQGQIVLCAKNDGASVTRDDGGTRASSDSGPRTLVSKSMLH